MKAVEKGNEILYFNHYDPADLEHIIDTQHKVIKLMKASNRKKAVLHPNCYRRLCRRRCFHKAEQSAALALHKGEAQQYFNNCFDTKVCSNPSNH